MMSQSTLPLQPVIIAGGSGTRLWPLSREHLPKPLISVAGEGTLLQQTVHRLDGLEAAAPVFVCHQEHRFLVAEQVRQGGHQPQQIILEPEGRNTAPALTVAALAAAADGGDPVLLAMPADHTVTNVAAFQERVVVGQRLAATGSVVTFGVVPDRAHTGYGYICLGADLEPQVYQLEAFVEKPDAVTAAAYVTDGGYLWNSGIFMLRASRWLELIESHRPDILQACQTAFRDGQVDADFFRVAAAAFQACPAESIDYAVMERIDDGVVVGLDCGWCDVGSWSALWELEDSDAEGNVTKGDVVLHDTHNSLLIAEDRLLAAVGLENVVAIETTDAVLVAHRHRLEEVKTLVGRLKADQRSEYQFHRRIYRPWGSYEGIDAGDRFQVKRLTVNPGAALSLQLHHHRAEHWVVVSGTARVTRGDEVFVLTENESAYIPVGVRHRLENPGTIPLHVIEVQSGSYLGEDDIVRFEDRYRR